MGVSFNLISMFALVSIKIMRFSRAGLFVVASVEIEHRNKHLLYVDEMQRQTLWPFKMSCILNNVFVIDLLL